ncbi:MAG: hypothetical protein RML94_06350 [Bacteroidia bacterium]|nr:hypothetical protein [Bacteroidia bacterium]
MRQHGAQHRSDSAARSTPTRAQRRDTPKKSYLIKNKFDIHHFFVLFTGINPISAIKFCASSVAAQSKKFFTSGFVFL